MNQIIDNDSLGEKGESRFKELCADASIICNKADRDRAGWDFVLDFPMDTSGALRLDHRKTPLSAVIQLKTVLSSTKHATLKLNMAERIAKELKPSFIVVLKVDPDLRFGALYVIHIAGSRLSAILERLRLEDQKGNSDRLNELKISFTPRKSELVAKVSGEELRRTLIAAIKDDMVAYIAEKAAALKTLGYESGAPYRGRFTVRADRVEDLLDMLLGDRPLEAFDIKAEEVRFGIALPVPMADAATMVVQPHSVATANVRIRVKGDPVPLTFATDIFSTPKVGEHQRVLLKNPFLRIQIDFGPTGALIEYSSSTKGARFNAPDWLTYWRIYEAVTSGNAVLEFSDAAGIRGPEVSLPGPIASIDGSEWRDERRLLAELYERLTNWAGDQPGPLLEWEELLSASPALELFDRIAHDGMLNFETHDELPGIVHGTRMRAIFANAIELGDRRYAYYGVTEISAQEKALTMTTMSFKQVRAIAPSKVAMDAFVEAAKSREGVEVLMQPSWDQN